VARCAGHPGTSRSVVILLSGLAWLNLLVLVVPLHWVAYAILAAGLATGTGSAWNRLSDRGPRVLRRCVVGLLLALAAIVLFQAGGHLLRRERQLATLAGAPADAPNILLIVLDTVRADLLGCYGDRSVGTPQLDRLSAEGTLFERAQATAPWTLPSHGSMFTGHLPHHLSGDWMTPLDNRFPTLAERLQACGYATAGFVANTRYCSRETGLARGFLWYRDFTISGANFALCTALGRKFLFSPLPALWGEYNWPGRKTAATVNREFLDWQSSQLGDRPFFAYLNYWDAHDPYLAPAPFDRRPDRPIKEKRLLRDWWWTKKEGLTDVQITRVRAAHDDCLRYLDHQLGQLLQSLEQRGLRDNTLVIVTADHGEHFGEHGLFSHGNSLYQELLHVPLLFVWPDHVPAGRRVAAPVSLVRLPSTVAKLVGLDSGVFPGESLASAWKEEAGQRETESVVSEIATQAKFPPCHGRSPVARGEMKSVIVDSMKYIRNGDGEEELYDLERDPEERHNLAGDEMVRGTLERLQAVLRRASGF
ncbi:MAG: sulfatase, partial [Pirellulales bacterium]